MYSIVFHGRGPTVSTRERLASFEMSSDIWMLLIWVELEPTAMPSLAK